METVTCRLLPHARASGPENMAADEALLETAMLGRASLRFYGWSEATVSLGYFQSEKLLAAHPELAGLPFVRRHSGGGALVHHHEVTYALALPAGPPWQAKESWLCRMHGIIGAALARLGVTVASCAGGMEERSPGLLCFRHITPGDLLIAGHKVVGSAQRRQRGALLQHGGILLATSPHAPMLPGIRELASCDLPTVELVEVIRAEFAHQTSWSLVSDPWTSLEIRQIEQVIESRYATEAWNRRR